MKKLIYITVLLTLMLFSINALAITMDVEYGTLTKVKFNVPGIAQNGYATEFILKLNDMKWENFLTKAYCVDLSNDMLEKEYNVYLNPIDVTSDKYLHAAWLMDQHITSAVSDNQKAGLQLAIWNTIYDDFINNTTGDIGNYYKFYYQDAINPVDMWKSLSYNYVYTTYEQGVNAQDLLVQLNPVPEPGTLILLGMGAVGLRIAGKRYRK